MVNYYKPTRGAGGVSLIHCSALCRYVLVLISTFLFLQAPTVAQTTTQTYNPPTYYPPKPCPPIPCINRTQTQGGWGATPNGNNPASYLYANFASAFPNGVVVGDIVEGDACNSGFTLTLDNPKAVTDFLPSGSTARALTQDYTNPGGTYSNVFAGQVVALTLSVGFDNASTSFGASDVPLKDMIITTGVFTGKTVSFVLAEANKALAGCATAYSISQLNDAVSKINESFVDGNQASTYIMCPPKIPVVTLKNCPKFCVGDPVYTLTGGYPAGGTYYMKNSAGVFVAVTTFNPTTAGDFEVRYQYTNSYGCMAEAKCVIKVYPKPEVKLLECPKFCVGDPVYTLTGGYPAGGTYYINGVQATTFNPTTAGEYTLTYKYTNPYTYCKGEASCVIKVYPKPYVKLPECPKFCVGDPVYTLTGGYPAGGTYYIDGVAATTFDPTTAGEYTLTYKYSNGYCEGKAYCKIKVYPKPEVKLPECPKFCVGDPVYTLTGGYPAGGTYYINGVAATTFNPTTAGEYTLTYKYMNPYTKCEGKAYCTIKVYDKPVVTLPECPKFCVGDPTYTLTGGSPAGGTYYINGVPATTFTPSQAGTYTLTYKYTNPYTKCEGKAYCTIKVYPQPYVKLPECPKFCVGDPVYTLTGGYPAGGTYYIDGVEATTFNPTTAGEYTLTYKYSNGYCEGKAYCKIKVYDKPVVTLPECPKFCVGDPTYTLTGGSPAGGTYYINGVAATTFTPTEPGTYNLTYKYTNPYTKCEGKAYCTIKVYPQPYVKLPECPTFCVGDPVYTLTGGYPAGGTYYINGVEATTFNPTTPGEYTLSYKYSNGYCEGKAYCKIKVYENPVVDVVAGTSYCVGYVPTVRITATPSGGSGTGYTYTWSVPAGATNPGNVATFEATVAGTYTVIVTDSRGCKGTDSVIPVFVPCKPLAGCTPGYWKNHYEAWGCGYTPGTSFFSVFDSDNTGGLDGGLTLGDAVGLEGGEFNALVRHATAALLNACHNGVNYPYSQSDIIQAVVSAFDNGYATLGGKYYSSVEALKNELDRANNLGCPLNNSNSITETNTYSSVVAPGRNAGITTDIVMSAYPNPFSESSTIDFTLREAGAYSLTLFDVNGKAVREISSGVAEAGTVNSAKIDGNLPAGIYIARLRTDSKTKTLRIMLKR